MKIISWTCLCAALFAVGCNGNTVVESTGGGGSGGGGNGGGGTTTTSTTSTTTVPPECAVATDESGPYKVTFQFKVTDDQQHFLRKDCSLNYSISSCADGYSDGLSLSGACTIDCAEADNGCIQCGACPLDGIPVVLGAPIADGWSGNTFTFSETATGCMCHEGHVAPAGKYRITVPVYASAEAATSGEKSFDAIVDFELPAPNDTVDVVLAPPPP